MHIPMELLAKVATYEQNIILHQAYAHLGLEKFIIWFFAGPMAVVRVIVQKPQKEGTDQYLEVSVFEVQP